MRCPPARKLALRQAVEAFAGDATVTTGSGDIELGAVGGSLRSKTGSGSLAVGRCDGEAVVTSGWDKVVGANVQ